MLLVLGFPPLPPTRNYHHPPTLPTQSLQPMNSRPIGPRTSPPLTSLILSQQTFRLKITTFPAESCGDELIISAENNTNRRRRPAIQLPPSLSCSPSKVFADLTTHATCGNETIFHPPPSIRTLSDGQGRRPQLAIQNRSKFGGREAVAKSSAFYTTYSRTFGHPALKALTTAAASTGAAKRKMVRMTAGQSVSQADEVTKAHSQLSLLGWACS